MGKISNLRLCALATYKRKPLSHWILLLLSSAGMLIALPALSLVCRIYNQNGGKSKWIISWAAVSGWPITALILVLTYFFLGIFPTPLTPQLILSYTVLGFISAFHNLLYAYAYALLPPPTSTILDISSLVFACLFGYFLANNKLNASTINAIVIIFAATTFIALDSDSGRHDNVSDHRYIWGFIWDLSASVLHGLTYALSELVFIKLLGRRSFHVALEQRTMVSLFAFMFATVGAIVNKEFQRMRSEAKAFAGGEAAYIKVLVWAAITHQLGGLGCTGVIFLTCTVNAGMQNTVRAPITTVAGIIFLNDPVSGFKILSFLLTLWGFASYIYGCSSSPNVPLTC